MKKAIYIFLILAISSICITARSENPYTGKYENTNNTILELDSNNNCTIINTMYKEAFYTYGKYSIEDNKINITIRDDEANYYGVSSLNGKFEGSNIKIFDSLNNKEYTYSKR